MSKKVNTVALNLEIDLVISDELLKRLQNPDQLRAFALENAFRNNRRIIQTVSIDVLNSNADWFNPFNQED